MRKIVAFFLNLFAGLALMSSPVNTMVGGAGSGRVAIWTNPYVTDGLVAMWDGEWNVGGGIHDPNASYWLDLAGGRVIPIPDNDGGDYVWSSNSLAMLGNGGIWTEFEENFPAVYTAEFVVAVDLNDGEVSRTLAVVSYDTVIRGAYLRTNRNINLYWSNVGEINITNGFMPRSSLAVTIGNQEEGIKSVFYKNGNIQHQTKLVWTGARNRIGLFCYEASSRYKWPEGACAEICCIRFYDRCLSEEEIAYNYMIDMERFGLE